MELDSRFWSIFIYVTITSLFVASICTPYDVKGVTVTFGDIGLWKISDNATTSGGGGTGHFTATQVLMCIAAAAVGFTFIGYVMLCRSVTWVSQFVTFLSQIVAGILSVTAAGVFASNDSARGEGWWLAVTAGALYLLNGFVILIMPCLDSDHHKHGNVPYIS